MSAKHWEYQSVRDQLAPLRERLNALGSEGWELVSIIPPDEPGDSVEAFFKRRVKAAKTHRPKQVFREND